MIGNYEQREEIENWLNQRKSKVLLLIGPLGCGKTSIINEILESTNCSYTSFGAEDTSKNNLAKIKQSAESKGLMNFFEDKKCVVIVDDIQNTIPESSNMNLFIQFINQRKKRINHIICISADPEGSKLSELKKNAQIVRFIPPNINETIKFLTEQRNCSKTVARTVAEKYPGDIRTMLQMIPMQERKITIKSFNTVNSRDNTLPIKEFTKKIFHDSLSIPEITRGFENDTYFTTLLIHENYPRFYDDFTDFPENLSFIDTIEKKTYAETNWDLLPYIGIITSFNCEKTEFDQDLINSSFIANRPRIVRNRNLNKKLEKMIGGEGRYAIQHILEASDVETAKMCKKADVSLNDFGKVKKSFNKKMTNSFNKQIKELWKNI